MDAFQQALVYDTGASILAAKALLLALLLLYANVDL